MGNALMRCVYPQTQITPAPEYANRPTTPNPPATDESPRPRMAMVMDAECDKFGIQVSARSSTSEEHSSAN